MLSVSLFKKLRLAALIAAIFTHGLSSADQSISASEVMLRMSQAARERSYKGFFTYQYQGKLRSMQVVRVVRDGQAYKRITSMDGAALKRVWRGQDINCTRAAHLPLGTDKIDINDEKYAQLQAYYNFYIHGDTRIADRQVLMVEILPKDKWRYGYMLASDKQTGLMLQSVLLSQSGKPLERFQFIDISFDVDRDSIQLSSDESEALTAHQPNCLKTAVEPVSSAWVPRWLPPGFALSSHRQAVEVGRQSLTYTDGLAVFSVFVGDAEPARKFPSLDAKLGNTVAVLGSAEYKGQHYPISVVGEIPYSTANRIATSIQPPPVSGDAQPLQDK